MLNLIVTCIRSDHHAQFWLPRDRQRQHCSQSPQCRQRAAPRWFVGWLATGMPSPSSCSTWARRFSILSWYFLSSDAFSHVAANWTWCGIPSNILNMWMAFCRVSNFVKNGNAKRKWTRSLWSVCTIWCVFSFHWSLNPMPHLEH